MSGRGLYANNYTKLEHIFEAIPKSVISLDLSLNEFENKTGAELALGLSGISAEVNTLILAGNGFGHKTSAQLARVLAGIPISVTSLDWSNCQLGHMSARELRDFTQIIPLHIKFITLKNNGFFYHKTPKEIDRFLVELGEEPAQFAMIALGLSLFFHANPTEMFVFGTGLTLFGAAGFTKSMHDVVSVRTALNALN